MTTEHERRDLALMTSIPGYTPTTALGWILKPQLEPPKQTRPAPPVLEQLKWDTLVQPVHQGTAHHETKASPNELVRYEPNALERLADKIGDIVDSVVLYGQLALVLGWFAFCGLVVIGTIIGTAVQMF